MNHEGIISIDGKNIKINDLKKIQEISKVG
jgi:hypothetical protein